MILYRGDGGTPTSFGTCGRRYSTDSRTGLQCLGHLPRSRRLTTPWPSFATAPVYNALAVFYDHAGSQQGGQLARPHRLTTPRPTHLSAPAAGSAVIDFSFTMVIINSAVIITDLTHQVKFIQYILYYILLSLKEQLLWLASSPVQDNDSS